MTLALAVVPIGSCALLSRQSPSDAAKKRAAQKL